MNNGEPWNNLLACSRVFVEVQAMEPLLRGGHGMTITRSSDHVISLKVYAYGDSKPLHRYKVRAKDVTNEQELRREMDALWRELVTKRLIDLNALEKEAANG